MERPGLRKHVGTFHQSRPRRGRVRGARFRWHHFDWLRRSVKSFTWIIAFFAVGVVAIPQMARIYSGLLYAPARSGGTVSIHLRN